MSKTTKKETEVIIVPENEAVKKEVASVETFITKAIESNLPVETMERLFTLQLKVKEEQAKASYIGALAHFQSEVPVIEKTKAVMNKDGKTIRYKYAPMDSIVEQIKRPLARNGFAYTWTVKNEPTNVFVTAIVTHIAGHSETSSFQIPIDPEGYMTAPQKIASALTFAKRYSLCNVLGISTSDEDTDATDVGKQAEPKSDRSRIIFALRALGEKNSTKEEVEAAVKKLAKLELKQENFAEIASRLEILISEQNEN